jgi:hypothetical protein
MLNQYLSARKKYTNGSTNTGFSAHSIRFRVALTTCEPTSLCKLRLLPTVNRGREWTSIWGPMLTMRGSRNQQICIANCKQPAGPRSAPIWQESWSNFGARSQSASPSQRINNTGSGILPGRCGPMMRAHPGRAVRATIGEMCIYGLGGGFTWLPQARMGLLARGAPQGLIPRLHMLETGWRHDGQVGFTF